MQVRLFQEEVSPVVEIHLDTAVGMSAYSGKLDTVLFMAAFLYRAILASEGKPVLCRDGYRFSGPDFIPALLATAWCGKPSIPPPFAAGPIRPIRYVLSDFLYADGLSAGMERYAAGSGQWLPVMVLARSEIQPPWRGFLRLTEFGRPDKTLDRLVDERAVAEYQARLVCHEEGVAAAARRHGASLFRLDAPDEPLTSDDMDTLVRRLVEERVVAPR